jgi:hypothetical protein
MLSLHWIEGRKNKMEEEVPYLDISPKDRKGEIWKGIKDLGEYYEVSSHGRVRSLPREYYSPAMGYYMRRGRVLKQTYRKKGKHSKRTTVVLEDFRVKICISEIDYTKTMGVSRLVAEAFLGDEKKNDSLYVFHIDLLPMNNRLENLFWANNADLVDRRDKVSRKYNKSHNSTNICRSCIKSQYKGVSKIEEYHLRVTSLEDELNVHQIFKTEQAAITKYLYYLKKYRLDPNIHQRDKSLKNNPTSKYPGISKRCYYELNMTDTANNIHISKDYLSEIKAAKKYDFYIKKYNLKRKGNFI